VTFSAANVRVQKLAGAQAVIDAGSGLDEIGRFWDNRDRFGKMSEPTHRQRVR